MVKNKKYLLIGSGLIILAFIIWGIVQLGNKKESPDPVTKDRQAWAAALEKNDPAGYNNYLAEFPDGENVVIARQKMDSLVKLQTLNVPPGSDEQEWNAALNENTIDAFKNYQALYKDGKHFNEAQLKINELENQKRSGQDDDEWENALSTNTLAAFQQYKNNYPKGKHIKEAQFKINTLVDQQKLSRQSQEEEQAWKNALNTNTIEAFQNYQNNYPNGKFSKEARDNITMLDNRQKSAEDEIAWEAAVNTNTIRAYREYQNKFPDGKHFSEAGERITNLTANTKQDISGTWINSDENTRGITKLIITNNKLIHAFGKCKPQDCDWNEVALSDNSNNNFSAVYDFSFKKSTIKIIYSNKYLRVTEYAVFNDGRAAQTNDYTFRRVVQASKRKPVKY